MTDTVTISWDYAKMLIKSLEELPNAGYGIADGLKRALASPDDGWVKVDEEHPVPQDLKPGDEITYRLLPSIDGIYSIIAYRRRPSAEQGG